MSLVRTGFRVYLDALRFAVRSLGAGRVRDGLKLLIAPVGYWRFLPNALVYEEFRRLQARRILDVSSPKLVGMAMARADGAEVVATDLDDPALVGRWKPTADASGLRRYTVEYQDARRLAYPDNSFDLVYSISVIEHIPGSGDTEALAEMARVCRPGGSVVVEVPWRHTAHDVIHEYDSKGAPLAAPSFYERYYDRAALEARLQSPALQLTARWFLGEGVAVDPWIATPRLPRPLRVALLPLEPWLAAANYRCAVDPAAAGRPLAALLAFRKL